MIKKLQAKRNGLSQLSLPLQTSFTYLQNTIRDLPGIIYWKDLYGRYLGCNQFAVDILHRVGAIQVAELDEIIGKTDYDLFGEEAAQQYQKNDQAVMRNKEVLTQEEMIKLPDGQMSCYLSIKRPLYDERGKVIGIIANAIDITDQKEAERLKANEQAKFRKTVNQMIHDIGTPLATLNMLISACTEISEENRIDIREALMRIFGIFGAMLNQYTRSCPTSACDQEDEEKAESLLLSSTLVHSISEKKHQYQDKDIKFIYDFNQESDFAFIHMQPHAFKRMISNIINNAVDAFDEKSGEVTLTLEVDQTWMNIRIADNGKGMPADILEKIMNNIEVTAGKKGGHGIGMGQVRDTLANNNGKMALTSELGRGTEVRLTFPRIAAPDWIATEINLATGDTVLILDDDSAIHGAWDKRFHTDVPGIPVLHFRRGAEVMSYLHGLSYAQQKKLFLLTDYELLRQEFNGLHVVEKTGLKRSILVTSHYGDPNVKKLAAKTKTKILPKSLAAAIPIHVHAKVQTETPAELTTTEIVVVDDDELFARILIKTAFGDLKADYYSQPDDFLENISKYSKGVKICLDKNFASGQMDGIALAKILHQQGFHRLFLISGEPFTPGDFPDYLTVVDKIDADQIRDM